MKNLKMFFVVFAVFSLLTSCSSSKKPEEAIKVGVLKGPTAMGLSALMNNSKEGKAKNNYDFQLLASPEEIVPLVAKGELDIASVPSNVASILYNNTDGKIKVININTLGVLHIVEAGNNISSVSDLKGKTIYASGKGGTPEYVLNYILSGNGIDPVNDVNIEYKSEHSEVVASLSQNPEAVALLPEPFVTVASEKNPNLVAKLDLTDEWNKINSDSALVMGVTVANADFIEKYPQVITEFLEESSGSTTLVNYNIKESAEIIGNLGIVDAAVAEKAIPNSNIVFIDGENIKPSLGGFLEVLFNENPQSVGGALPDDNFYYKK